MAACLTADAAATVKRASREGRHLAAVSAILRAAFFYYRLWASPEGLRKDLPSKDRPRRGRSRVKGTADLFRAGAAASLRLASSNKSPKRSTLEESSKIK